MSQRRGISIAAVVPIAATGIGGCALPDGYENWADLWGDAAGFCGYLQECGDHKDREGGRPVTNASSDNASSGTGESTIEPTGGSADQSAGE